MVCLLGLLGESLFFSALLSEKEHGSKVTMFQLHLNTLQYFWSRVL